MYVRELHAGNTGVWRAGSQCRTNLDREKAGLELSPQK